MPFPLEILREEVLIWKSPFRNAWMRSEKLLNTREELFGGVENDCSRIELGIRTRGILLDRRWFRSRNFNGTVRAVGWFPEQKININVIF
jgi:hypothetical protein